MMTSHGTGILTTAGTALALFLITNLTGCNTPQEQDPPSAEAATELADNIDIAALAGDEVQRALFLGDMARQGLAVTTLAYCSSPPPYTTDTGKGSISVTVDDVDPPGRSAGDSYATTYNNCVQFGRTLNGSSKFTIVTLTGDPTQPPPAIWSITTTAVSDLTVTLATSSYTERSNYNFSHGTVDGVSYARVAEGTSNGSVTRAGVTTPQSGNFKNTLDIDYSLNTYTYTMSVDKKTVAGDVLIETLTPLTGTVGDSPGSGVIRVTRSTATTRSITTTTALGGGNARVDVDNNGDGVIDSTVTLPWSTAGFGCCFN